MTGSLKNQYSRARQSDLNRIGDRSGVDGEEIPEKKECLVTEELLTIMKENFDRLDKYEDLVVPRAQIVEAIRKDVRAKKFLNKGVVYLPKVKKEISLRKILNQIEQEEFIKADNLDTGDSNFISSKKYISWKKFMDYFVNYSKNQAISDFEIELKKDTSDDQNLVEVPRSLKEKMRSIFNDMKDEEGYVKAMSFLNNLKQDSLIIQNMDVQVRARAKYGEVPDETLCDILSRIEDCIEDYTDWDEFLQYFTKRGTPIATELAKKVPQLTHVVAPLAQIKPTIKRGGSTLVDEGYGGFGLTQPSVASALHKSPSFGFSSLQNPIVGMVFTDNQSNYKREDNYRSNYRKVENVGYNNQREAEVDERTRLFDHRGTPADGQVDLLAQTRFGTGKLHNPPDSHGYKQSYEQNYNEERDGHLPPGFLQQQGHDQYDELVYPSPDQDYIPRPRSAGPMYQEEDDPYVIDDYVYFGDNEKRHKITVPTPLNFEAREHRRNESTKYRKFKEYIEEKRRDDEDALRFRFRAKSVPKAVKEPLFDKIMSVSFCNSRTKREREPRSERTLLQSPGLTRSLLVSMKEIKTSQKILKRTLVSNLSNLKQLKCLGSVRLSYMQERMSLERIRGWRESTEEHKK